MKYLIKESQLNNIILDYIGDLTKGENEYAIFWKNSDGKIVARTNEKMRSIGFGVDFMHDVKTMFALDDDQFYDILFELGKKLIGKEFEDIYRFDD